MWTVRRRGRGAAPSADEQLTQEFEGSNEELVAEIERLSELNRARRDQGTERLLLHLRNLAGIRHIESAGDDSGRPEPDFAAIAQRLERDLAATADRRGLPEIAPGELTPELLRAGILRHGCLLVRGLIPRAAAVRFAQQIERAFEERERHDAGKRHDGGYYAEFEPDPRYGDEVGRHWIRNGGGVLAVDSPLLSFEMLEMLDRALLLDVVRGYLRQPVLITAQKTTLRKAEPSVAGAWHQDGKFMGEVAALNLWLSLSRCGDEAPGLDVVPRRLEHHVATATDDAMFDNMVSQRMAEKTAGEVPILRPIFEPGDALLFDDLFLHKTGSDPSMREPRFAIESWFFGASGFPADYAPLAI
jgi:hypothetical protein